MKHKILGIAALLCAMILAACSGMIDELHGGGCLGSCGYISITGGTVNATGGEYAAGIGCGNYGSCGNITITDGVTSVTATKGTTAPDSIGRGADNQGCGTVSITASSGKVTQN